MTEQKAGGVNLMSRCSLRLHVHSGKDQISSATGFIVLKNRKPFLITNWHVLSGIDPITSELLDIPGRIPDHLEIYHNTSLDLNGRILEPEPVLDHNVKRLWFEHPRGKEIDVVALPFQDISPDVEIIPLDLNLADVDMAIAPAIDISIIGYPLEFTGRNFFAIWKTGHIAYEPEADYDGKPMFLVDATAWPGMSGSLVIKQEYGAYVDSSGGLNIPGGKTCRFLGIYSGRINGFVELGMVWKPKAITEILDLV